MISKWGKILSHDDAPWRFFRNAPKSQVIGYFFFDKWSCDKKFKQKWFNTNAIKRRYPPSLGHFHIFDFDGYIDVGDGCWRQNVLVTTIRCWRRFRPFWLPTFKRCHHFVTNFKSLTSYKNQAYWCTYRATKFVKCCCSYFTQSVSSRSCNFIIPETIA